MRAMGRTSNDVPTLLAVSIIPSGTFNRRIIIGQAALMLSHSG
jgi:hypothetical protein